MPTMYCGANYFHGSHNYYNGGSYDYCPGYMASE